MVKAEANGFSLVEVVVAIVVLSVGMLAMAASTGYIAAEVRSSTFNTQRAVARRQVVEQLRAMPFNDISCTTAGSGTVGRYSFQWRATCLNTNLKRVLVIASGPAVFSGRAPRQDLTDTAVVEIARP